MIQFITRTIFFLISAYVVYFLTVEILNFLHLNKYKKQGVRTYYKPVLGFIHYLTMSIKTEDHAQGFKDLMKENEGEDLVAVNKFTNVGAYVLLRSPQAVTSFLKIEKDTIRDLNLTGLSFFGFFFQNGQRAMMQKSVFAKIFHQDNLNNLCCSLVRIADSHCEKLKREICNGGEAWTEIDVKAKFFIDVFEDFTEKILFGSDNSLEIPKLKDGRSIVKAISDGIAILFKAIQSMFNIFSVGLADRLNLIPEKNEFLRQRKEVSRLVRGILEKREASGKKSSTTNFLDSVIEHNRTCKEEDRLTPEEIFSNFELFQFAASDTSFYVTTSALVILAQKSNSAIKQRLAEELKAKTPINSSEVTREILDSCDTLASTIKETLRIMPPVVRGAARKVAKDVKVLGKTIFKGDKVLFNHIGNHSNPTFFEDAHRFDVDRFNSENEKKIPRNAYTPFSVGKRNCVGQYLGKMMAKITTGRFMRFFDIEQVDGFQYKKTQMPIYGFEKAMLRIRPRKLQ